jgi:nucleoside-diphosphate-sugar epimerase
MENKSIAILGCGWLGTALAKSLMQQGYRVSGSTTTLGKVDVLKGFGIDAHLFSLGNPSKIFPAEFLNADWLIISTPPAILNQSLTELTSQLKNSPELKIIMISSTAVYPTNNLIVKEDDAIHQISSHSGIDLLHIENSMQKLKNCTILRLGGLYGPKRHPGSFLAGKKGLNNGNAPVNLVHQEDVIGIISIILQQKIVDEVFNVVASEHPSRKEFYQKAATAIALPLPEFKSENTTSFKIVDNQKVKTSLLYEFKHDDPMNDMN